MASENSQSKINSRQPSNVISITKPIIQGSISNPSNNEDLVFQNELKQELTNLKESNINLELQLENEKSKNKILS